MNRIEQQYTIANEAAALIIGGGLAQLGFVQTHLAGAYGPAVRCGSVTGEFIKSRTDDSVAFTLAGPPSELAPVMRHLSNTPIPGELRPLTTLMKSSQAEIAEQQAAKLVRARKAQAAVLAKQAERERARVKFHAAWQLRAVDAGAVESRLSSAGYEMRSGADGQPIWVFGSGLPVAQIEIRTDQQESAGAAAEITLQARTAAAFDSAKRLITAGSGPIWPINRAPVEARPAQFNKSAPAKRDMQLRRGVSLADPRRLRKSTSRRQITAQVDSLLFAFENPANLARAIGRLPKRLRKALHDSLEH